MIDPGARAVFTHVFGTDKGEPQLRARSGTEVTVVRECTDDECDPECQPMYVIVADDGWESAAWDEELQVITT